MTTGTMTSHCLTILLESFKGILAASTVRLFKNNIKPVESTLVADMVEADFGGYVPVDASNGLTWGDAYLTEDGYARIDSDVMSFDRDDGPVSNNIYGYYITGPLGQMLTAERLGGVPILMTNANNSLRLAASLSLGPCPPGEFWFYEGSGCLFLNRTRYVVDMTGGFRLWNPHLDPLRLTGLATPMAGYVFDGGGALVLDRIYSVVMTGGFRLSNYDGPALMLTGLSGIRASYLYFPN